MQRLREVLAGACFTSAAPLPLPLPLADDAATAAGPDGRALRLELARRRLVAGGGLDALMQAARRLQTQGEVEVVVVNVPPPHADGTSSSNSGSSSSGSATTHNHVEFCVRPLGPLPNINVATVVPASARGGAGHGRVGKFRRAHAAFAAQQATAAAAAAEVEAAH